jgi:hypothetical protein
MTPTHATVSPTATSVTPSPTAGAFRADGVRWFLPVRRATFPDVDVHEVDAGCSNVDDDLAGTGLRGRAVADRKDLGTTMARDDDSSHPCIVPCTTTLQSRALPTIWANLMPGFRQ